MGGVALAQMQEWFSEWGPRGLSSDAPVGGGPPGSFSELPHLETRKYRWHLIDPWPPSIALSLLSPCFNSSPVLFFSASKPPKSILTFMERKLGAGKSTAVLSIPENYWLLMQIGPQLPRANRGHFNNYNNSPPFFLISKGEVQCDISLQNRGHMRWITFWKPA